MSVKTKDRVFGLDVMRSIAILFVLFAHTSYMLPYSPDTKNMLLMLFGFSGVEFFFVLSGFLIGKILLDLYTKEPVNLSTAKHFWVRRWFRTLPAYYLALFLRVLLDYRLHHTFLFSKEPYDLLYLIFCQNVYGSVTEFFKESWSLAVEEWFYLLLPLWFWLFAKYIRGRKYTLYAILCFIIIINLLRTFVVYAYDPAWNLHVRLIVPLRLDSIMIGVLLAWLYIYYKEKWKRYAGICLAGGLVILVLCFFWLAYGVVTVGKTSFLTGTIFFTIFSGATALCVPYLSLMQKARFRPVGYVITYISVISYSLYLFHGLAIFAYQVICHKFSWPVTIPVYFVGSWVAIFIVCTITYRFYEKPFTNLREKFRLKRSKKIAPEGN